MLDVLSNFDGVIGIGGGSTIDVAKILATLGDITGSVKDFIGSDLIKKKGLPTIMLPTTSGTGAEVTPNAIVKNEEIKSKKGITSSYLIPDRVILDPGLTLSLPRKITAETGLDAFTHAIECYICNKSNPMSDAFSLESMRLIHGNLLRAVEKGDDKSARYDMALGSLYGGIAITNSGTGGVHALAYPLGGEYGISHGLSNAILLAQVMNFNASAVPDKFEKIAELMGADTRTMTQKEAVGYVLEEIQKMIGRSGISTESIGISEDNIDELSRSAISVQRLIKTNPRSITYDVAREIYRKALFE
jgi:alcohol dehydrogenase